MKRKHLITALLVACLALTPVVVMASSHGQMAVGSIHTDFGTGDEQSPTELTNVSVTGSGDGASLGLLDATLYEYNPIVSEGTGNRDFSNRIVDPPNAFGILISPDNQGRISSISPNISSTSGANAIVDIYIKEGQPSDNYEAGTLVKEDYEMPSSAGRQEIPLDDPYTVDDGFYTIVFAEASSSPSDAGRVYVHTEEFAFENGWSEFSSGTIDSTDDNAMDIDVDYGFQYPTGKYISADHNAEKAEQAFVDLTLSNADAVVDWEYFDGSTWQVANSATYSSSGTHSLDISGHESATQWRADVTFEKNAETASAELHDEGVEFFNREPSVDNATATPTGTLTARSDYEIDVSDPTFGLEQGDTVTAELFVDGEQVASDTLASNGTASVDYVISEGGSNSYHWEVTDSGGSTTSSQTYSVTVPSTLFIYNESSPSQLIESPTEVQIRLFGQGDNETVLEETISDGTLDLAGVPADQRHVVTIATENENYHYRRLVLDSIYDQSEVYLLPQSQPSVNVDYTFNDYSGNYPSSDTYFYISKAIRKDFDEDGDDETEYQTIAGDVIGPTGSYPATLQEDERYRLRIQNRPNQRLLGAFTATANEVEQITIRGLTLEPPDGSRFAAKRTIETGPSGQRLLTFKYRDPAPSNTSALDVSIRYRNNDTIVYEDSAIDVTNYSAYDIPLANDTEYVLEYNATIDGEVESSSIPIGAGSIDLQVPLDPDWLGGIVVVGLTFVMALGGRRKWSYIATTVVILAGVVMYLGVAAISPPLWWLSVVIAVGSHLRVMQSPRQ